MALTKQQKKQSVREMQDSMSSAVSVVFLSFNGLTVEEASKLRTSLYEAGGGMRVIPKRLLKIALNNLKLDFDPTVPEGQLAVAWGDEAVAPAKALDEFAREHEDKIRLLAGTLEGDIMSAREVAALASLPSAQQLRGQLVAVISAPIRGLVTALSGIPRGAVGALQAIADQRSSP